MSYQQTQLNLQPAPRVNKSEINFHPRPVTGRVFFDFLNKITQLIQKAFAYITLARRGNCVCVVAPGDASGKMPAALSRLIYHLSFLFTFAPHSGTPNSISRALVSGYAHTKASESCHPASQPTYFLRALGRTESLRKSRRRRRRTR
jgi:hypothetical protein